MKGRKYVKITSKPEGVPGLHLFCNTPGCPTPAGVEELEMAHPGSNKSTYKCPLCKNTVITAMDE